MMGMDPVKEPQFMWIAEEASKADIQNPPKEWRQFENEDGETLYYHTKERKLQKTHPLIDRYMDVYHKARSYTKQMVTGDAADTSLEKPDVKLAAIAAEVMGRASKGLPPATPDIIEGLAKVVGVDATKEYFLFRTLKQTLEAYVEKK